MRVLILFFLIFLQFSIVSAQSTHSACALAKSHRPVSKSKSIMDVPQQGFDVSFYGFDLEMSNTSTELHGSVQIHFHTLEPISKVAFELIDAYTVDSVSIDSVKTNFTHHNDSISITLPQSESHISYKATVYYHGEAEIEGFFSGISNDFSGSWGNQVTWTLSEPLNAKHWFPCKQDLQDKADSAHIFITVPDHLKVGSNGILTNVIEKENGKLQYQWLTQYPIAYYLISVTIAEFVEYNTYAHFTQTDSMLIQNFIYNNPETLPAFQSDLDELDELIEMFSEKYGKYPFYEEKYGHCMAPFGGGMEHQTMTSQGFFEFSLDAHEMGHQWFGDHVTCGTWQDIWINEGFARYSEYLAYENLRSKSSADSWMSDNYADVLNYTSGSVYVPFESATDENRIFDFTLTYNKGGALVHMIRYMIDNDSLFFLTLKNFQEKFSHQTATGLDFKQVAEETTGVEFDEFFNDWYFGEGYPIYDVEWDHENDTLMMVVKQTTTHSSVDFFDIPLTFILKTSEGSSSFRWLPNTDNDTIYIPMTASVTAISLDQRVLNKSDIDKNANLIKVEEVLGIQDLLFYPYPNPSSDEIFFKGFENEPFQFIMVQMDGKICLEQEISKTYTSISIKDLPNGKYTLIIKTSGQSYSDQIMINR